MKYFSFIFSVTFGIFASGSASAQSWGCYDPAPGHPTLEERRSFIRDVSKAAKKAEVDHGVPASAIAAMAIVESGYGWTRIALDARNYFGWKYYGSKAAGGRASYQLACQPPEDDNNRYVVFNDLDDAVGFVASKLAALPYYRSDTDAYRSAKSARRDVRFAVDTWVSAISDPYNWKPTEYVTAVRRVMNNPEAPSDILSQAGNLYELSGLRPEGEAKAPESVPSPGSLPGYDYAYAKVVPWTGLCEEPDLEYPNWEGYPVRLCTYSDIGVTVKTHMLNADRHMIATWIATACSDAGVKNTNSCVDYLVNETSRASSMGIFPVAGYIPEPLGGDYCFLFRDGVTVRTATRPKQLPPVEGACGPDSENAQPITAARVNARISSTTREDYRLAGGTDPVGEDENPQWALTIRRLYQAAWGSPRNQLLSAKAISAKIRKVIE